LGRPRLIRIGDDTFAWKQPPFLSSSKVVDRRTDDIVLTSKGRHGDHSAGTILYLGGQRAVFLPVYGTHRSNAVMVARGPEGDLAHFRMARNDDGVSMRHLVDIVVPTIDDRTTLVLVIVAAPLLRQYFVVSD